LFIQEDYGKAIVKRLTKSDGLWELINKRRAKLAKKEQGTVELRLSIGAMKPDDTNFLSSIDDLEDSDNEVTELDGGPKEDDIQYSQTCIPASPPLVRAKISGAKSRLDQTSRPQQVTHFLKKCMASVICEWYNAFSQEHFDYLTKFLKANYVEGSMFCFEKWECLGGDVATWPSLKHLPPKMYGPSFDKKLFFNKAPEKNKYPPRGGGGQLQCFQMTREEAEEEKFRRQLNIVNELKENRAASASLPIGTVAHQEYPLQQVLRKSFRIYCNKGHNR
jgi:hypothetical protein